jgi:hypothetical protein
MGTVLLGALYRVSHSSDTHVVFLIHVILRRNRSLQLCATNVLCTGTARERRHENRVCRMLRCGAMLARRGRQI